MDPDDLLDYAIGQLEGPRREQLERQIAGDPALADRVARLARILNRLLDDGRGNSTADSGPASGCRPRPNGIDGEPAPHIE